MAFRLVFQNKILRSYLTGNQIYQIQNIYFKSTMAEQQVNDITFSDLKTKVMKNEVYLIDVREPNELKKDGRIPNSINIPLNQIVEAFQSPDAMFKSKYGISKPEQNSITLVLSCRSGKRATEAFLKLQPLGYSKTFVYRGSFLDWVDNGGPVEK